MRINLTVYCSDRMPDILINSYYRMVIATDNKERATEIAQIDNIIWNISKNPNDIRITHKKPHTIFCEYELFSGYQEINPRANKSLPTTNGSLHLEITEWPRKCCLNNCKIPSHTACIRHENFNTKQIEYTCSTCALNTIHRAIRYEFNHLLKVTSFQYNLIQSIIRESKSDKYMKDYINKLQQEDSYEGNEGTDESNVNILDLIFKEEEDFDNTEELIKQNSELKKILHKALDKQKNINDIIHRITKKEE